MYLIEIGDAKEVFIIRCTRIQALEAVPVPDPAEKEKQRSLLSGEIGTVQPPQGAVYPRVCM
ncbi:MAG: hypothetical protein ACLVJX_09320 [Merdibacter sp.]